MPHRLIYAGLGLSAAASTIAAFMIAGPMIEAQNWPVREEQTVENVRRDAKMIHFTWVGTKLRTPALRDITATLYTPTKRFGVQIYRDLSYPDAPCSEIVPMTQAQRVGTGRHNLHYCVGIPSPVDGDDQLKLTVVLHYSGFLGLWDLPQTMVDVNVPIDPAPASPEPMAAWGD